MIEVLSATGILLSLVFVAVAGGAVHWSSLLALGASVTGIGFGSGVITAIGYHRALYRALRGKGVLTRGWWWHPTPYNAFLEAPDRRHVMGWFYAGMTTLAIDFAGCALLLAAIFAMRRR